MKRPLLPINLAKTPSRTILAPEGQASFSLVEALLAMTILGIAVTSILTTFSASLVASRISQDYALAATLMDELRAELRTDMFLPTDVNQGNFTSYPEFAWKVDYYYTEIDKLYQVRLTIAWIRANQEQSLLYYTYHYYASPEEETAGPSSV
ncbi:MAG: type II secretion system protein [Candidatus Omnitrophota bacterium]